MSPISHVIVVGAGPSGLMLALVLSQNGIKTTLVDLADKLDEAPRATHYSWPAQYEFIRAGVFDEILAAGFRVDQSVSWRKLDGTLLGQIDIENIPVQERMVCLPLNHLSKILYGRITKEAGAEVLWSHKVTKIGQDAAKAWVDVETKDGEKRLEADYVVGCDGANSQVRRSLFGDWEFPGITWEQQIVATNAYYPDLATAGWGDDSAFLVDKENWAMIAKIQTDGLLRITYGETPGLSREEYIAGQPAKYKALLPGNPDPDKFEVINISPYKVHQRLAKSMRVGRFLLAADAAHLCNPFGGLGLTGGLVDVGNLADCLVGIHKNLADDTILDRYSEVRRQKYSEVVNPASSANIKRLWQDPEAADQDEFFQLLGKAKKDPAITKRLQDGLNSIMHDFRKEYRIKATDANANGD